MTGAGLFPGDIAVVDRSVTPTPGCVVLALLDGEFHHQAQPGGCQEITLCFVIVDDPGRIHRGYEMGTCSPATGHCKTLGPA
jgi:hypothetical protein